MELVNIRTIFELTGGKLPRDPAKIRSTVWSSMLLPLLRQRATLWWLKRTGSRSCFRVLLLTASCDASRLLPSLSWLRGPRMQQVPASTKQSRNDGACYVKRYSLSAASPWRDSIFLFQMFRVTMERDTSWHEQECDVNDWRTLSRNIDLTKQLAWTKASSTRIELQFVLFWSFLWHTAYYLVIVL